MVYDKHRIKYILLSVSGLLVIPLIAMQFCEEVNWTFLDFVVAGLFLFILGLVGTYIWYKFRNRNRHVLMALLILFAILLWAELAVGIFGSPLAGS